MSYRQNVQENLNLYEKMLSNSVSEDENFPYEILNNLIVFCACNATRYELWCFRDQLFDLQNLANKVFSRKENLSTLLAEINSISKALSSGGE